MVSMETEHLEFRVQVWRYWKGASVAVSLTPKNYCNWQVWEVWEVWIRPCRPLHVFLMKTLSGCPVVHLTDSHLDLAHLLRILLPASPIWCVFRLLIQMTRL